MDCFVPVSNASADRAEARGHLAALWEACARLDMDEPIAQELPIDFPDLPETDVPGFRLYAGRGRSGDSTYEAFLFALHDVVGMSVALTGNAPDEDLDTWARRYKEWRAATPSGPLPVTVLDECLAFFALTTSADAASPEVGEAVWQGLRNSGLECWEPAVETGHGFGVWEGPETEGRRVIAAIAPAAREPDFDAWLWWRGQHDLALLPRYLLHAAKLRYESRVYRRRKESLQGALTSVDSRLEQVLNLHREVEVAGPATLPGLLDAQRALTLAKADGTGLLIEVSHLRALHRTVAIARENLRALSPAPDPDEPALAGTLVGRDLALATWLSRQIDHDIGYAEAVGDRAAEVHALTSLRLEAAAQQAERARSRMNLIQTTLLGAVLYGLLAYGTFGIAFEPPSAMRVPLLAALATLLIALPALVAHWHDRYGWFDRVSAASFGAAWAWVLIVALWPRHDPPWYWAILAAVAGGGVALSLTRLHDRGTTRRDRR